MPHLEIYDPGVSTAAQVWTAARAAHYRRPAAYEQRRPRLIPPPAPAPMPPRLAWTVIHDEVAQQAGVERWTLSKDGGRKLATVSLRQLAVALTRRLTSLSLPAIGRRYGVDHSTIVNSVARMRPLMAVLELELADARLALGRIGPTASGCACGRNTGTVPSTRRCNARQKCRQRQACSCARK
jgi:hypothetical protein